VVGFWKILETVKDEIFGFWKSLENVKDEVYCLLLMDKMSNWFITFIVGKKKSF
jgi:hypothetical protein